MIPGHKRFSFSFSDLQAYVAIALKHLRLMALIFVLTQAAGLFYYMFRVPLYYSKSLILYRQKPTRMDEESVWRDSGFRALVRQLRADHIVLRTAHELGIDVREARDVRANYVRKVRFSTTSEHDLQMEVWAVSRALVRHWPERVLNNYLEYRDDLRRRKQENMITTFTHEIMLANRKADEFHKNLQQKTEELRVLETRYEWKQLQQVPQSLVQIRFSLEELKRLRRVLQDGSLSVVERLAIVSRGDTTQLEIGDILTRRMAASGPPAASANGAPSTVGPTTGDDAAAGAAEKVVVIPAMLAPPVAFTWQDLDTRRRQLVSQLKALSKTFLPGHRKVQSVAAKLKQVEEDLAAELDAALGRLELEHARQLNVKTKLEKQMPRYRELAEEQARIQREMQQFQVTQLGWEKMAAQMQRKLAELDFAEGRERVDVQFAGLLQVNPRPVSPPRLKLLLFAVGLGMVLALSAAFVLEYLDHTVHILDQVEAQVGLPGLAVVPQLSGGAVRGQIGALASAPETGHAMQEVFRVMRTNLLTNKEDDGRRQVIMIASSIPREGKSMVAANLSGSLGQLGERTLLIDADLRRGKLHRRFANGSTLGLGEILAGHATLNDCLLHTEIPQLTVLPRGKTVHGAAERLLSPRFAELLRDLRGQYQRIIIDTPPVLGISETSGLLPLVDGVVMVVWCGYTPMSQLQAAVRQLQANGANFYGCVLNRLDLSAATNYYHYYYYSNYYYHSYETDHENPEAGAT